MVDWPVIVWPDWNPPAWPVIVWPEFAVNSKVTASISAQPVTPGEVETSVLSGGGRFE